jgi:hypothetical protein
VGILAWFELNTGNLPGSHFQQLKRLNDAQILQECARSIS